MNLKSTFIFFLSIYLLAIAVPALFIQSCCPSQFEDLPEPADTTIVVDIDVEPDTCDSATKFSVRLCIDDNLNLTWSGLWDECFNLGCETSWSPALGLICLRCIYPLCPEFKWRRIERICEIPEYTWTTEEEFNFYQGCIQFAPDECITETVPNCYDFIIYASGCPY